jgi:hypothetical protein
MTEPMRDECPMREIELNQRSALDPDLLVAPSKRTFGTDPDIEVGRLRLRVGERPVARNLRALYELRKRGLPEDLEVFISYDIWLLTHSVSVVKEGGFKKIRQIGYQMRFPDKPKVTVLEVLPQTDFVTRFGGFFKSEADIQINGHASVPESLTHLLDMVEYLSFDGQFTISKQLNVVGRVSFSVITPIIQAVGVGDNGSEWVFKKHDRPLLGDQLMMQIVLTPRRVRRLNFKARVYATVSSFNLVPARFQSDWLDLQCML